MVEMFDYINLMNGFASKNLNRAIFKEYNFVFFLFFLQNAYKINKKCSIKFKHNFNILLLSAIIQKDRGHKCFICIGHSYMANRSYDLLLGGVDPHIGSEFYPIDFLEVCFICFSLLFKHL